MKKGFTLAEVLVTMLVLGIVAAVVVPLIVGMRPDKDKVTYKKALYSLQAAVSAISDDKDILGKDAVFASLTANAFCTKLSDALNIRGAVKCVSTSTYKCGTNFANTNTSCFNDPNFTTTDGIRFWGLEGSFPSATATAEKTVKVCGVTKKDGNNIVCASNSGNGYSIKVRADGKVTVPTGAESNLLDDALNVRSN